MYAVECSINLSGGAVTIIKHVQQRLDVHVQSHGQIVSHVQRATCDWNGGIACEYTYAYIGSEEGVRYVYSDL